MIELSTLERHGSKQGAFVDSGALWSVEERQGPSLPELQLQLDETAAALAAGLAQNDLTEFYALLRSSDLPFVAPGLAHACCTILHRFGGISPAVALAIENHLHVVASLITFPLQDEVQEARRQSLLRLLNEERLLVANTSSRVHGKTLATQGVTVRRDGDGFRVNGSASYVSLATQSDLMLFSAMIEGEGPALFVFSLRDSPGLDIGPFLFPRAMLDSDTRRFTFQEVFLPAEALLMSGVIEQMVRMNRFQLIWHQLLIAALYLGAAASALEEVRLFLRTVHGQDGPLAELDGMVVDTGRLMIRYRSAWALVRHTADQLSKFTQSSHESVSPVSMDDLLDLACVTKHSGTICAEEVVTAARRIIGGRSFIGPVSLPIERFSLEILFAPLGPEVNAVIERRLGRRALGETPILAEQLTSEFHLPPDPLR
jgi:alkylation response protein AidB-like acyl-CoA dehydrogenase